MNTKDTSKSIILRIFMALTRVKCNRKSSTKGSMVLWMFEYKYVEKEKVKNKNKSLLGQKC